MQKYDSVKAILPVIVNKLTYELAYLLFLLVVNVQTLKYCRYENDVT